MMNQTSRDGNEEKAVVAFANYLSQSVLGPYWLMRYEH